MFVPLEASLLPVGNRFFPLPIKKRYTQTKDSAAILFLDRAGGRTSPRKVRLKAGIAKSMGTVQEFQLCKEARWDKLPNMITHPHPALPTGLAPNIKEKQGGLIAFCSQGLGWDKGDVFSSSPQTHTSQGRGWDDTGHKEVDLSAEASHSKSVSCGT